MPFVIVNVVDDLRLAMLGSELLRNPFEKRAEKPVCIDYAFAGFLGRKDMPSSTVRHYSLDHVDTTAGVVELLVEV